MSQADHNSPGWHPTEIRFLVEKRVIEHARDVGELKLVKSRWVYRTLREVFITSNGFVIKRFSHFPGRRDLRKVWQKEHRALERLVDLEVPASFGYVSTEQPDGVTSVAYVRECLDGRPLTQFDEDNLALVARLLARIHHRGVVTLDPQAENFLLCSGNGQRLAFIDFGRARCFSTRNPWLFFNIGKEMLRLQREGKLTPAQFTTYLDHYRKAAGWGAPAWSAIMTSYRLWRWRYQRKDRR